MKKGLSRTATMALGAVVGYLRPKLAADAKLDVAPLFGEVTAENFKDKKAGIITGLKTQFKGKLANDAELDGVGKVLDSIEELKPNSALPPGAKKSGEDDELDDEPEATDEEKDEERRRVLADHLRGTGMDEDKIKAAVDAAYGAKQAGDEPPPFNGKPKSQTADAEPPITKKAMDAAIAASTKSAVTSAVKQQQEIHEAERVARKWVGDLDMAFDSAEHVYRTALTGLGIENKDIHPSALRAVLEAQPVPGAKTKSAARPAMDAAATNSFAEMFPGAARIRNL